MELLARFATESVALLMRQTGAKVGFMNLHDSHSKSKSGMPVILGDKGGVLDYCTGTFLVPKQLQLDCKTLDKATGRSVCTVEVTSTVQY